MNASRRAFRPAGSHALESRAVLSTMVPTHLTVGHAARLAPVVQPTATITDAGSSRSIEVDHSGRPEHGQLTFSAHAMGGGDGGPETIKVDYHNESKVTITSATFSEKLAPGLTYVPGVGHTPPGGTVSVVNTPRGQVVELELSSGIAPGSEGYLEFQAK